MNKKRWLDTGYLKASPLQVDLDANVITGVKVCSAGEAKGHGVHLDAEFIEAVATKGNDAKKGLKARFGHPNMCSEALGTYIGRFKNFSTGTTMREDGTEAACCLADLHLSETAKDTPNGDLHSYIMEMADKESDMLGTSIVFIQGETYRKNDQGEKVYPYDRNGNRNQEYRDVGGPSFVECKKLCACDCVDDPAANDGMFSAFSGETVAGQLTEFLDLHPQIFDALTDKPEIMEAIAQYGNKFDEFLTRYQQYRDRLTQRTEAPTMPGEGSYPTNKGLETTPPAKKQNHDTKHQAGTGQEELSTGPATVQAAVQEALKLDRARQAEIRELGAKFGFTKAAEEFANSDKSADEFRTHILNQSPEDWKASLAIKNPTQQASEQEIEEFSEGASAVEKIKERRQARFGTK